MSQRKKLSILGLSMPASFLLVICFVFPLGYILVTTLAEDGPEYYIKFLTDPFYLKVLWRTVWISLVCTGVSLLFGYPTAYFLARTRSRMKNMLLIVTIFPFLVSAVVRAYGWQVILGKRGIVNQFLMAVGLVHKPLVILNTWMAVVIGMVHLLIPYMILSIAGVIQNIDPNVEYASYSLGCNKRETFWKVIFPLSAPGIISGCILVFTLSITSFVTPQLLGGAKFVMMSQLVDSQINTVFNLSFAAAISYILLFIILLFQFLANWSTKGIMNRVGGGGKRA